MHIKGDWGTNINIFDNDHEVEISFIDPHTPTLSRRISHNDAIKLRDALNETIRRHADRTVHEPSGGSPPRA